VNPMDVIDGQGAGLLVEVAVCRLGSDLDFGGFESAEMDHLMGYAGLEYVELGSAELGGAAPAVESELVDLDA